MESFRFEARSPGAMPAYPNDLVRLASRVSSMLSTTPTEHWADLLELHGQLL